jgi:hypothetical protein
MWYLQIHRARSSKMLLMLVAALAAMAPCSPNPLPLLSIRASHLTNLAMSALQLSSTAPAIRPRIR